jgi:nucleotide-binding universal stress UspA family protein
MSTARLLVAQGKGTPLKKILIATDGSEAANKAIILGSDIASKYGAEVVLVHVLLRRELSENLRHMAEIEHLYTETDPSGSTPTKGRFPAGIALSDLNSAHRERVLRALGEEVLQRAANLARTHGAKKITTRLEDGDPVNRILEIAGIEKVNLIVSGARGLSDLKGLLVGSVSHQLSHLSPVTCITVK